MTTTPLSGGDNRSGAAAQVDWYVHWKGAAGRAFCLIAHEAKTGQRMFTQYAMPGDLLESVDRGKVTCPDCMGWLHG